jgi:hypothetical protein
MEHAAIETEVFLRLIEPSGKSASFSAITHAQSVSPSTPDSEEV